MWQRRGEWGGSGGGRNPKEAPPASSEEVGELLALQPFFAHVSAPMLPQSSPMSSLAPFFQETSPDHVLPLLLGTPPRSLCPPWNLASATLFLVWVQGTHLHR